MPTILKPATTDGGPGAPADGPFITVGNDGDLPTERALIAGDGLVLTDNGPNSTVELDVVAHPDGSIAVHADDVQVGVLATDAQHGIRGGGTQHALATPDPGGVAGFMSPADKDKLDDIATGATNTPLSASPPEDVDTDPAETGVSTFAARADHKHDAFTEAAGASLDIGDSATEGTAVSLARSDHQHAFPAPISAPPDIAPASDIGTNTTPARSNHTHEGVHQIIAGTGVAISPGSGLGDVTVGLSASGAASELITSSLSISKGSNNNPDAVFTQYESNLRIATWKVLDSTTSQQPIHAQFRLPDNFDASIAPTLLLQFMIDRLNAGTGGTARVRVRIGSRAHGADVPVSPGGAFQQETTADLTVTEPASGLLRMLNLSVPLAITGLAAGNWFYIVIDRGGASQPPASEYPDPVHLATASVKVSKV